MIYILSKIKRIYDILVSPQEKKKKKLLCIIIPYIMFIPHYCTFVPPRKFHLNNYYVGRLVVVLIFYRKVMELPLVFVLEWIFKLNLIPGPNFDSLIHNTHILGLP